MWNRKLWLIKLFQVFAFPSLSVERESELCYLSILIESDDAPLWVGTVDLFMVSPAVLISISLHTLTRHTHTWIEVGHVTHERAQQAAGYGQRRWRGGIHKGVDCTPLRL